MILLSELKETFTTLESATSNYNTDEIYRFLLSLISAYAKENPKYLEPNSETYKFLKSFFQASFFEELALESKLYFPLFMDEIDSKICLDCLTKIVLFFTEDEEFKNKVCTKFTNYNFSQNYKEEMLSFIDQEFANIIGLKNIQNDLKDLVILITNNKIRLAKNLPPISISMHMVFSGNPGTGKTTIARLIGKMYYHLGLLKTDKFLEVSRQDLVAEYVGQTAIKTAKVLEEAKDGILFIDEAYSLTSTSNNDYGKESVETILKFMEDNRDNTVIIVAGYEKEINNFINSNPGLKSRFNKFFNFPNYSPSELYEIFLNFCLKGNYQIPKNEEKKIKELFNHIPINEPNFSNARYIRNIYEKTVLNQARRIDANNITDNDEFMTIRSEDVSL